MKNSCTLGHLASLFTVLVWGTTFISTKILLREFQPVEILFYRFIMGFLALFLINPRPLKGISPKQELLFAAAGLSGVTLYYLLENIALTFTMASNVGVITSIAPFFTAVLAALFVKDEEKLHPRFFLGFLVAISGIFLISTNGSQLKLNPAGDLLAVASAFMWGCYSNITKKISGFGYNVIQTTRRIFFYGILFMIPALFLPEMGSSADLPADLSAGLPSASAAGSSFFSGLARFADPVYLFNFIFLGLGASALCFVTWNYAVQILGAVKTCVYIYMIPVITIITSFLVLKEQLTVMTALGTVLTLAGLFISEHRAADAGCSAEHT